MVHTTKNTRIDGDDPRLEAKMRRLVPKPGADYIKVIRVTVGPGESIDNHAHPEHTVVHYVSAQGVPILVEGEAVNVVDGQTIYLAPDVGHEVPRNNAKHDRVSIAMVVDL